MSQLADPGTGQRAGLNAAAVIVQVELNGITVPLRLDEAAITAIRSAVTRQDAGAPGASPLMTIAEAAEYLRCKRQRIDDLLCQRRLSRIKEGRRTLIRRDELEQHLQESTRRTQ